MTDPRSRVPVPGRSLLRDRGPARPAPLAPPRRARLEARAGRGKPESTGVRMVLGLAGLASASALATRDAALDPAAADGRHR